MYNESKAEYTNMSFINLNDLKKSKAGLIYKGTDLEKGLYDLINIVYPIEQDVSLKTDPNLNKLKELLRNYMNLYKDYKYKEGKGRFINYVNTIFTTINKRRLNCFYNGEFMIWLYS